MKMMIMTVTVGCSGTRLTSSRHKHNFPILVVPTTPEATNDDHDHDDANDLNGDDDDAKDHDDDDANDAGDDDNLANESGDDKL